MRKIRFITHEENCLISWIRWSTNYYSCRTNQGSFVRNWRRRSEIWIVLAFERTSHPFLGESRRRPSQPPLHTLFPYVLFNQPWSFFSLSWSAEDDNLFEKPSIPRFMVSIEKIDSRVPIIVIWEDKDKKKEMEQARTMSGFLFNAGACKNKFWVYVFFF